MALQNYELDYSDDDVSDDDGQWEWYKLSLKYISYYIFILLYIYYYWYCYNILAIWFSLHLFNVWDTILDLLSADVRGILWLVLEFYY